MPRFDYTATCKCGWQVYPTTLKDARDESKAHVEKCERGEVYIDRNADFGSGMEIDDSFAAVIIRRKTKEVISVDSANDFLNRYFFSGK